MGLIGLDFNTHITQGERQKKQIMAIVCAGTRRVMHVTKRVWGYCSGHAPMKQSIQAHVWDMGGLPAPDIGRHAHGAIMRNAQNRTKQSKTTHTKKKNITAKRETQRECSYQSFMPKKQTAEGEQLSNGTSNSEANTPAQRTQQQNKRCCRIIINRQKSSGNKALHQGII